MSNYRRAKTPGGGYFFTVVTDRRQPLLTLAESRAIPRSMMRETRQKHPFAIDTWVLLPEHLHCIGTLPPGDTDYPTRWGIIKGGLFQAGTEAIPATGMDQPKIGSGAVQNPVRPELVEGGAGVGTAPNGGTQKCRSCFDVAQHERHFYVPTAVFRINQSKAKYRESTIGQRRFWEHEIRDQEDFNWHFDYIHWNPVKYRHVVRAIDWPYSTFHQFRARPILAGIGAETGIDRWVPDAFADIP